MKESNTQKRLLEIMDEKQLKQTDILRACLPFAQKYGVKLSKADISLYVSGKVTPNQDKLAILSMGLNVNEAWLMGYDVSRKRVNDTTEDSYLQYYAQDDAMAPLLNIGDIAYVNEQKDYSDGNTILFELDNKRSIRKVNSKDGYIELRAMNPYYPLIVLKNEEFEKRKFKVIGKVVKIENKSAFK